MENTYSITVTNKFSLALDEDEDPLEILKLREQEKEAKKKEKLSEKENKNKQQEQQKTGQQQAQKQKSRLNKENQQQQQQQLQQPPQQRNQDAKKDQAAERKPVQQRVTGDRNVKFSSESREEHNNRRNREDVGERPPRIQNDYRRAPAGEGREPRESREPREPREPREQREQREQREPRVFRNSEDRVDFGDRRGRGGGRGMSRGARGGGFRGRGGFDNRGKREYDRQSGSDKTYGYSGIKPIDKKDGAGSHNWGTHNDEIEESLNQTEEWTTEKLEVEGSPNANESKESVGTENPEAPTEEKPAEEEARELTLDEWKALRQNRAKPQYNLRKAGEGEDLSRWKKMYALERKKEGTEEEEDEEEEYDATEYPQRVGRQKHVLDIEIQFSDNRRSAGGRGARGGRGGRGDRTNGRGFGNRGPPRGNPEGEFRSGPPEQRSPRERQNAPKVDDEHDFPSLG